MHGALLEAEILTSPLPVYLLNLAWFLGASVLPTGELTPPKWSTNVPICLRNLLKNLVHGALIEAEILTSLLSHIFAQLGLYLGTATLPAGVSSTSKTFRKVSIHLRNLQNVFGAWVINRS